MNCKQGDLAIVVKSLAGNIDKVVQCVRLATDAEIRAANFNSCVPRPMWVIDRRLPTLHYFDESAGPSQPMYSDAWLRPIRDNDGEDETLTWAGKPEQVAA